MNLQHASALNAKSPAPGMYLDVPEDVYRAAPGVNHSLLCELDQTPAHCRYRQAVPREQTAAMKLGTLIDLAIFGLPTPPLVQPPATYTNDKGEVKAWNWNANACKAWRDDQESAGHAVITPDQAEALTSAKVAINQSECAQRILRHGHHQVSCWWEEWTSEGPLLCKSRMDWLPLYGDALVDLKSTFDSSPEAFRKRIEEHCYDTQAAFYLRGFNKLNPDHPRARWCWIVAHTEPPYLPAFYYLDAEDLQMADTTVTEWLHTFATCHSRGYWPGYPDDLVEIRLSRWHRERRGRRFE